MAKQHKGEWNEGALDGREADCKRPERRFEVPKCNKAESGKARTRRIGEERGGWERRGRIGEDRIGEEG